MEFDDNLQDPNLYVIPSAILSICSAPPMPMNFF
jgi:hypothetical protein